MNGKFKAHEAQIVVTDKAKAVKAKLALVAKIKVVIQVPITTQRSTSELLRPPMAQDKIPQQFL